MSLSKGQIAGLTIGAALIAALVGGQIALRSSHDPKVAVGKNDEVYYYRRASKEDAMALGQALRGTGFFNDRGTSVLLWRGGGPSIISFVVSNGAWQRPDAITNYTEIGRRVANSVGGLPLEVHLVDPGRVIRRKMNVGKLLAGADILYYFGDATLADAHTFAAALQSAGYFSGLGFTAALLKGEGTAVSFVVQDGGWDQPAVAATLERLVRQVAPSAGGLPIRLRLLDREMGIRKELPLTVQP